VIDDKTIALCRSMGERAEACLAFFLGHELAHFANNHNWGAHFARQTVNQGISPALSVEYETQADRFGGFYATLAGYDSLSVAGQALGMMYREYGIPSNLPGYLPLAERQKEAENAREFLAGLLPMYDAAGLLMALGYYQEAVALYDVILHQFPSREIYNNAGVALACLYNPAAPWLLDGSSRLPERRGRGGPDYSAEAAKGARRHFEQAITKDPDYAVAHLNLGLLLQAIGVEPERAAAELKTAAQLAKGNAIIAAVARGEAPATTSVVSSNGEPLERSALLPSGKLPSAFIPVRQEPVVDVPGGLKFFARTVNELPVFTVGPIGPDRKHLYAVVIQHVPDGWRGHLGPGKEIRLFPEPATLYESVGVLVGSRGALVYQVR
jgi:tetratricopeptide (TPR) repeat protein